MAQYKAYTADTDLKAAIKQYSKRTGLSPSIIVVPDWYEVTYMPEDVAVLSSESCSLIMITDENESEFETMTITEVTPRIDRVGGLNQGNNEAPKKVVRRITATCPHCKNTIRDWSLLGHYWEEGMPPYWDRLSRYIFKRDKFTCVMCDDRYEPDKLDAHHIIPRNKLGPDSSENLITLCEDCHDWLHDYYETIEERTGNDINRFEPIMRFK